VARSGNGVDLSAIYQLLTEISGRLDGYESKLNELVGAVNEHNRRFDQIRAVLNEHNQKLDDLAHGQTELRDALSQYHYSVVGQGMAVNLLAERVTLIEKHLGLPSSGL
jgi:uncharacterized coiled-coil DUF342 family protein